MEQSKNNGSPEFSTPEEDVVPSAQDVQVTDATGRITEKWARTYGSRLKDRFVYLTLLSQEIVTIRPLMRDFFNSVNLSIEAKEERLNKHIEYISNVVAMNSLSRVVACYTEKPEYPLNIEGEPVGYIYFYVFINIHNERELWLDQIWIKPEFRKYEDIAPSLRWFAADLGKRAGTTVIRCKARTVATQRLWQSFGFKIVASEMEFRGNVDEFIINNNKALTKTIKESEGEMPWLEHPKNRSQGPSLNQS